MPFAATWMNLEIVILTVILSDTERQIYIYIYHLYVESKKKYKSTHL